MIILADLLLDRDMQEIIELHTLRHVIELRMPAVHQQFIRDAYLFTQHHLEDEDLLDNFHCLDERD